MTNLTRKVFAVMFAAGAFGVAVAASAVAPANAGPMVRDHRSSGPMVRDHRDGGRNGGSRGGGVVVTSSPRDRGCSVARCPSRPRNPLKCVMRNGRYKCS